MIPPTGLGTRNMGAAAAAAKSLQSCPTLCDPIDGSPPGSSVPGVLQARTVGCCLSGIGVLFTRKKGNGQLGWRPAVFAVRKHPFTGRGWIMGEQTRDFTEWDKPSV